MATHFARGILGDGYLISTRLSSVCHNQARLLPEHRRTRFLASRALLAELMFMLYGISELPEITVLPGGRPLFRDSTLPRFSIAYTGNIVGVALTTEGDCGLALQRSTPRFHTAQTTDRYNFTSNEALWINNQSDPNEASAQLMALRQSVLKLTGEVESNSPDILQLLPGSGRLRAASVARIEAVCDAEDVLVWSVAVTPAIERLKVWEYSGKGNWRCLPDAQVRANEPAARLMRFTSIASEKAFTLNESDQK
ncbi:4'-phosphopantetheinyl transferase family protein [Superficieibacter sp. BNK-5]|uniref:4'-phosphopantetheinyl transferase family protein n=1 Tax=Superficieibacter sp. BNK-5 TaxID=3376142 RepID=UPI0039BF9DF5